MVQQLSRLTNEMCERVEEGRPADQVERLFLAHSLASPCHKKRKPSSMDHCYFFFLGTFVIVVAASEEVLAPKIINIVNKQQKTREIAGGAVIKWRRRPS